MKIPFSPLHVTGQELEYVYQAVTSGQLAGDGSFTQKCQSWLEETIGSQKALLTNSCTAALEMAAILANIQPGDEVILPSFTFVSTANAIVLRGGVPVFVDIRPDTLNLDESKVEAAITPKTKAISPVHYAGVGCEMNELMTLAKQYQLTVIEDAAQGILATYENQPIGSFGDMAAFSFHATKNIVSGEGGALVINNPTLVERAEIIWEKGTNRSQFFRGEVDKYTWVDIGSSFLPSELTAAFLWAQLQQAKEINQQRMRVWQQYHKAFEGLELASKVRRPCIPTHCQHNAHIYYLLTNNVDTRTELLARLKAAGIQATFHYVPLHSSPAGQKFGRVSGGMSVTNMTSDRMVRLPLSASLTVDQVDYIIATVLDVFNAKSTLTEAYR
ncbi:MAG: dTDP-4-amino-4,6-dideoxygalactose transaminase [Leptolyngbyaceae cyanobacterium RU_5_1]|nr:dTDP-4-amino-4,6-dideoxygalactose transaminase [Leptolyngbyaceae cyanobacterium RU_5_1]